MPANRAVFRSVPHLCGQWHPSRPGRFCCRLAHNIKRSLHEQTLRHHPARPHRHRCEERRDAIDFGTNWCGYCKAAEPHIDRALAQYPEIAHVKVEDGPGRALGRSFRVKLWPTVVVMKNGQEVARVVRPDDDQAVVAALILASGE
jgi:thioredoxin 1